MKPKNKLQAQVFELSKTLPSITNVQKEWAYNHSFEHIGRRNAKGVITCMECGNSFHGDGELIDNLLGAECPECHNHLKVQTTRKSVFKQTEYFCIITKKGGFQVLRFFLSKAYFKAGKRAEYSINEAVQRWIAPDGKYATIARLRYMSFYCDLWDFSSNLEIRPERDIYDIMPASIYPRQKLIPELKRSGYKGEFYGMTPSCMFQTLLADSRAETLLKAGQTKVLKYFAGKSFSRINDYWATIKICIRSHYTIGDVSNWKDYIDLLRFFRKDLHNAKYVCPANLAAEHDRYVKLKSEWHKRQEAELARKKALEDESVFKEMKSRFFGIQFTDGNIQIRVLESVEEFMYEGDILHHCLFSNEYHLKPDSLIFSACVDGQKIETVEFSLSKMKVVQSRGVCNSNTEYHDRIIELVNKNSRIIRKRIAA